MQSFIDERDIVRLNVTYNGFGRFNDDAHDFTLESDMLTGLAKAGALRHCTMYGCRGLEYPWQEESAEDKAPQELVMYDGAVIAGGLPCSPDVLHMRTGARHAWHDVN